VFIKHLNPTRNSFIEKDVQILIEDHAVNVPPSLVTGSVVLHKSERRFAGMYLTSFSISVRKDNNT